MKDRDLLDYSLMRLDCDSRLPWLRNLGLYGEQRPPRRLVHYRMLGSVIAHPSASHASERAVEAQEALAEQRATWRVMMAT